MLPQGSMWCVASAFADGSQLQILCDFRKTGRSPHSLLTKVTPSSKRNGIGDNWMFVSSSTCGKNSHWFLPKRYYKSIFYFHMGQSHLLSLVNRVTHSFYLYKLDLDELNGKCCGFWCKNALGHHQGTCASPTPLPRAGLPMGPRRQAQAHTPCPGAGGGPAKSSQGHVLSNLQTSVILITITTTASFRSGAPVMSPSCRALLAGGMLGPGRRTLIWV